MQRWKDGTGTFELGLGRVLEVGNVGADDVSVDDEVALAVHHVGDHEDLPPQGFSVSRRHQHQACAEVRVTGSALQCSSTLTLCARSHMWPP